MYFLSRVFPSTPQILGDLFWILLPTQYDIDGLKLFLRKAAIWQNFQCYSGV